MNISVGYLLISFNLSLMQCFEVSKNLKKMIVQGFGDFCQAQSQCKSQLSWTDLALLSVYTFWLQILLIPGKYEYGIKLILEDLNWRKK